MGVSKPGSTPSTTPVYPEWVEDLSEDALAWLSPHQLTPPIEIPQIKDLPSASFDSMEILRGPQTGRTATSTCAGRDHNAANMPVFGLAGRRFTAQG
jgi:hypothetical protein